MSARKSKITNDGLSHLVFSLQRCLFALGQQDQDVITSAQPYSEVQAAVASLLQHDTDVQTADNRHAIGKFSFTYDTNIRDGMSKNYK